MFCKKWIKIFATIIVLIGSGNCLKAQTQTSDVSFSSENAPLQEKIFASTDKSFYLTGEILWFKLNIVSADSLKALDLSKVAYVEILSAQQKPVLQATVALNNGDGNGSIYLPSSVTSGNYIFRAYTNWMKNFGADNYFQKVITVVNTLTPFTKSVTENSDNYKIDFFAEGGSLVSNIQSKITFKIINENNTAVNAAGNIVDENNNTIASFTTSKYGMGVFYFTPEANHAYTAVVNINGKSIKQTLPVAADKGFVMHVSNNTNQYIVSVNSKPAIQQTIYLTTNSGSAEKTFTQTTDANGAATFIIEKNQLPSGLIQLTVLGTDKQPQCEELVLIKPQTFQTNIKTDNNIYSPRSAVNLNLASSSANAKLSVAVYMIDSLQAFNDNDVFSLSSNNIADSLSQDVLLDELLAKSKSHQNQTQAFRFAPEHEGHIIEGKVIDKNSGSRAAHIRVFLSVPGVHFKFTSAVSNDTGEVFFDVKDAYGLGELVVQTAKEDSMYHVEIADPFSNEISSLNAPQLSLSDSDLLQLSQSNLAMQVQNAYTINQLNTFTSPVIDTLPFYGFADSRYDLDDYTRFNTMEEVLREYITGLDVRIRQSNYYLHALDLNHVMLFDDNPLVLVDGVPIFDMNKVIAYNPLKIKKAEVVKRKFLLNSFTADGILSYTTYKGDLDGFPFEPGSLELSYDGLQLQRTFYAPQYATAEQRQSRLPDYRTTLYWAPQITGTDKQISFYTSDVKGKYIAVVQGIDNSGHTSYSTTEFEVR